MPRGRRTTTSKLDIDKDGDIDKQDIELNKEMRELGIHERKMLAQRRMAWTAMGSMIFFTLLLMVPHIIPESRVTILTELSSLFYIGMASVIGAYMGMSAYMSRK